MTEAEKETNRRWKAERDLLEAIRRVSYFYIDLEPFSSIEIFFYTLSHMCMYYKLIFLFSF